MTTPTDKEVQSEKKRRAKKPHNLRRIVRQFRDRLYKVENENIGFAYAIQTLRYNMGLDNTKTDVSECLIKHESVKSDLEARLQRAVHASCSCGGKGPEDGCCQACEVWHRFHGRTIKP